MTASPLLLNVDDDRASQYAVTRTLRAGGYRVLTAGSVAEARALIAERRPDLVLLDVNLPDGSGLDLCAQLKRDHRGAEIMVLQHSATFSQPRDHARGLDHGADGYVTLPAEPEVLLATVRSLLRAQDAEREVRDAAERWHATFHAITDAVVLLSHEQRVLAANRAFGAWVGRPVLALEGLAWSEVCPDLQLPLVTSPHDTSEREVPWRGRWVRQTINPVPLSADRTGTVCVLTDLSERRRQEEERAALYEAERQARLQAERSDRAKDSFLALVSHELRTPLNAVLGWAHMLANDGAHDDTVRRAGASIERNARAQAKLIEDLLDVSRMVSGQLRLAPERLDLNDVVQEASESLTVAATAKGVELRLERHVTPVYVLADAGRLRQVIWNLVSNALKFTPSRGRVIVSIRSGEDDAELQVCDSGAGIAAADLPHVFERFWRAGESPGRLAGLGLGLAIVQHIAEAHGGVVEAASAGPGAGATFVVRLPRLPD